LHFKAVRVLARDEAIKKRDYFAGDVSGFFFINSTIADIIIRIPATIRLYLIIIQGSTPPTSRASPTKNHNTTITILLILPSPTESVAARNFHWVRSSRDKLPDTTLDNPIEKGFCCVYGLSLISAGGDARINV
jgi:hypothetical protein